jgi:hypothetical protein
MKMPYVLKKLRRMLGELRPDMSGIITLRNLVLKKDWLNETVLVGSDYGSMTSPGSIQQGQTDERVIPELGNQIQGNMREERETPSAMTCVCYGLLPCDRARQLSTAFMPARVHGDTLISV